MQKLATIDLKGEFELGFIASLKIWHSQSPDIFPLVGQEGSLPANFQLDSLYQLWVKAYEDYIEINHQFNLLNLETTTATFALKKRESVTNISDQSDSLSIEKNRAYQSCIKAEKNLIINFNDWLKSTDFLNISTSLQSLHSEKLETHRILIETNNYRLRKMPWQKWDLLKTREFSLTEIGLSSPNFKQIKIHTEKTTISLSSQKNVKILVILGKEANIEPEFKDIENLGCYVKVVSKLADLDAPLWQETWDILVYNGHSNTGSQGKEGSFELGDENKLTISDIRNHFQQAINHGVKLAIFNSCDGLGLAYQLAEGEDLHLPQIIVMREVLPVAIAPKFLKYFLQSYTQGLSLYTSLRQSRERLQILEKEYPSLSWLPILCQNPAEIPPRWLELGGLLKSQPYKGLEAFTEEDQAIYFGRRDLTLSLLNHLKKQKLLAVIGASGSGKSSVVLAGVIPQWLAEGTGKLPRSFIKMRPSFPHQNPCENLAEILCQLSPKLSRERLAFLDLVVRLEMDKEELAKHLSQIVKNQNGCEIILFIDQFEELYTLCAEDKRQSFLANLVNAVEKEAGWRIILTLRADFLPQALEYQPLGKILDEGGTKFIMAMTDQELVEAIALPAKNLEVEFAEGLVNKMIQDYRQTSDHLPMLQFALEQLWPKQKYGIIDLASYEEIGGITKALRDHAEKIYLNLSFDEQVRTREIFTQLVQPVTKHNLGEVNHIATRKIATMTDIGERNWHLVTKFANERLVVTDEKQYQSVKVISVELIHEVLIRGWERLQEWIDQDWEFRRWQERLREAITEWKVKHREQNEALLQGALLKEAESWLEQRSSQISEQEQEFIQRGLAWRDEIQREELARQKRELAQEKKARVAAQRMTWTATIAFLTVLVAGWLSWSKIQESLKIMENVALDAKVSTPELLKILPGFLDSANKKRQQGKIDIALRYCQKVITEIDQLLQQYEKDPNIFSQKDYKQLQNLKLQATQFLVETIQIHRLPQLEQELKQGNIGRLIEKPSYTDLEKQYTTGGLQTTYVILMRPFGVGADLDNSGLIDNQEAQRLPCELLIAIEECWKKVTNNRCTWYGTTDQYQEPICKELNGYNLLYSVFPAPYDPIVNRLSECKILFKPILQKKNK